MGELLQGMFKEAVGDDKRNRSVASTPFNMASANFTISSWGAILGTSGAAFDLL